MIRTTVICWRAYERTTEVGFPARCPSKEHLPLVISIYSFFLNSVVVVVLVVLGVFVLLIVVVLVVVVACVWVCVCVLVVCVCPAG